MANRGTNNSRSYNGINVFYHFYLSVLDPTYPSGPKRKNSECLRGLSHSSPRCPVSGQFAKRPQSASFCLSCHIPPQQMEFFLALVALPSVFDPTHGFFAGSNAAIGRWNQTRMRLIVAFGTICDLCKDQRDDANQTPERPAHSRFQLDRQKTGCWPAAQGRASSSARRGCWSTLPA